MKIEENRRAAEAEGRHNHNTRNDDDTKNLTTEAKGSKVKADDLTTEAKGGRARTEESRSKSEAATRDETIEITTKTTTMVNEQG